MTRRKHRFKKGDFHPVNPAHKGQLTRRAKRAGKSVMEEARAEEHAPGRKGKQARFALIAPKWHHGGRRKKRSMV